MDINQNEHGWSPSPVGRGRRSLSVVAISVAALLIPLLATPVGAGSRSNRLTGIVVDLEQGRSLAPLLDEYDLRIVAPLLPSRHIWLVEPTDDDLEPKELEKLVKETAKDLDKEDTVEWAEVDTGDDAPEDDRFHAWPEGAPTPLGPDAEAWLNQPDLAYLQLDRVHQRTTGEGIVVAILDTGVDLDHPALEPHLGDGHYDYVDDDTDPTDEGNGLDDDGDGLIDESYGHGTHAAGLVALVAPDAEILVYRVLDADGQGHPILIAQAIEDAIAAGADVINVSFGMEGKPQSDVLRDAFKLAKKHEVSIVAAVGNDSREGHQYPAKESEVLGVAAMGRGNGRLAHFSNYGKPAIVAAPGEQVVSTLPGGGFGAWSGTSMATPIVSGQVALIRSGSSDWKAKKVIDKIGKSATKIEGERKIEKGLIDILGSIEE